MVVDPADQREQQTSIFRIKASGTDEVGKFRHVEKEIIFRHEAPKQRRRSSNELLAAQLRQKEEELAERERNLHTDRRQIGGLAVCTKCQSKDVDFKNANRVRLYDHRRADTAEVELQATAEQLAKQEKLVTRLTQEVSDLHSALSRQHDKIRHQQGTIERQMTKAAESRERLKRERSSMVDRDTYNDVASQLEAARDIELSLTRQAEQLAWNTDELEEQLEQKKAELAEATAGPGSGHFSNAAEILQRLKQETGVRPMKSSVPARSVEQFEAKKLSVRHMAAVLQGRGEGENIDLVADALHRAGYLERLVFEADRMQPLVKRIAKAAVNKTQEHWTARHAVHIWDRLELSRSQTETLRHLLSYVYDPVTDSYVPIKAWVNPKDGSDFVLSAVLAGRAARERQFNEIANTMNIVVGANGRCERDAIECTSWLYSNFIKALRSQYSRERPAQPILFLDGTGGALGRGICHGEIGCADFISVGNSDTKQSRASLQPLFLYEGNDHAKALRENLDLAMTSYNKLVSNASFERVGLDGAPHPNPNPSPNPNPNPNPNPDQASPRQSHLEP